MNQLSATIDSIRSSDMLTHMTTRYKSHTLHLLLAEPSDMNDYTDKDIILVFKETEVILMKDISETTGNQLRGRVTMIESGEILTQITTEVDGSFIQALVPTHIYNDLNISTGQPIICMVNPSDISILRSAHGN